MLLERPLCSRHVSSKLCTLSLYVTKIEILKIDNRSYFYTQILIIDLVTYNTYMFMVLICLNSEVVI